MTRAEFAQRLGGNAPASDAPIVIEARDPVKWRQAFLAAIGGQGPVFLANPDWGSQETAVFKALAALKPSDWNSEQGWLMIPTGGTSGVIRLARHDQSTLSAAIAGYGEFFGESQSSAVGVLPLHHVGGLMAWLRCAYTGGQYVEADWSRLAAGDFDGVIPDGMTISIVPTQLRRLLATPQGAAWLKGFARVLVGGAALDERLEARAAEAGVRLVLSYGSTETAAMVAGRSGNVAENKGEPGLAALPHVSITLDAASQILLSGPSVFRGYWPELRDGAREWQSGDRGEWTGQGRFEVCGRMDLTIITGGEKVNPLEVEAVLQQLCDDERIAVVGIPDDDWGQRVVAVHAIGVAVDLDAHKTDGLAQLAKFKWPKAAVVCDPWPLNAVGKLDRTRLQEAAQTASEQPG